VWPGRNSQRQQTAIPSRASLLLALDLGAEDLAQVALAIQHRPQTGLLPSAAVTRTWNGPGRDPKTAAPGPPTPPQAL
jgi:hypothetical protein